MFVELLYRWRNSLDGGTCLRCIRLRARTNPNIIRHTTASAPRIPPMRGPMFAGARFPDTVELGSDASRVLLGLKLPAASVAPVVGKGTAPSVVASDESDPGPTLKPSPAFDPVGKGLVMVDWVDWASPPPPRSVVFPPPPPPPFPPPPPLLGVVVGRGVGVVCTTLWVVGEGVGVGRGVVRVEVVGCGAGLCVVVGFGCPGS